MYAHVRRGLVVGERHSASPADRDDLAYGALDQPPAAMCFAHGTDGRCARGRRRPPSR